MDVSIIFVNYKTKDLTINAIKSVFKKTKDLEFEIFVVDNNSQDGSIEAIEKEFSKVNVIKNPTNAGFGAANNLAIKKAQGKYVLCLNTDTLLINNAIKIMFDYMESNPDVGACGGQLYDSNLQKNPSVGNYTNIYYCLSLLGLQNNKQYAKKHLPLIDPVLYDNNCYITNIHGANIFIRKSVLDSIGLFDERFFMYQEDTDLCKRINDSGYKLAFVKDAEIIHFDGGSYNVKTERLIQMQKSLFIYFNKHYPKQLLFVKILYLLGYLKNLIYKPEKKKYCQMINFIWTSIFSKT